MRIAETQAWLCCSKLVCYLLYGWLICGCPIKLLCRVPLLVLIKVSSFCFFNMNWSSNMITNMPVAQDPLVADLANDCTL
jgi:hypothetical protein